jgi:uncharacterized protein with HEPN domain
MTDKQPIVGPEGLGSSVEALAAQVSAIEKSGDLKVDALRREWESQHIAVRRELAVLGERIETIISNHWQTHEALHVAQIRTEEERHETAQRNEDKLTAYLTQNCEKTAATLRAEVILEIKRIDALIVADSARIEALIASLQTRLTQIVDERHELYSAQFKASEVAVNAALAAAEKAVNAAFLASEKAIVKAEGAQKDSNERSVELQSRFEEQAKSQMPRLEATGIFKSIDDRFQFAQQAMDSKIDAVRGANDKVIDAMREDIKSLRESRSEGAGRGVGASQLWGFLVAALLVAVSLIGLFMSMN